MDSKIVRQCLVSGIHGMVLAAWIAQPVLAQGRGPDAAETPVGPTTTASAFEIPEKEKFQECWQATFTQSESYTVPKDRKEFMGRMVTKGRRDVVKAPVNVGYVVCYEKDGRGALVVNGSLVPMVRPADTDIYGDAGDVILLDPPVALYAKWIRPDQPSAELFVLLDKQTQYVTATKRTEDGKLRYKESSMTGTAKRIYP